MIDAVQNHSYRKGIISDYEGGREATDFLAFAKQITRFVV